MHHIRRAKVEPADFSRRMKHSNSVPVDKNAIGAEIIIIYTALNEPLLPTESLPYSEKYLM
jgi:hypothetical protein